MDTLTQILYNVLPDFARMRRFAVKVPKGDFSWGYSYLRFSSPEQAEGRSIARQEELRNAWLAKNPNVKLDTSLKLSDEGVSGFRGKHRTDPRYALAGFLDNVKRGVVPVGSYLIVENLDRLTRENPIVAIPAVLSLISAGIRIVQLAPFEIVYHSEMQQEQLLLMLLELSRGHGESKRKAGLLDDAWTSKKRDAREGKPIGRQMPAWIDLVNGKYVLRDSAITSIRIIFKWSSEGMGTFAIAKRLNDEGYPPIAKSKRWVRGYVAKILKSRSAIGEYQPRKFNTGRSPEGEPIPNYYPPIVTEKEFYDAQSARHSRDKRCGRPASNPTASFPFAGLCWCGLTQTKLHSAKRGNKRLVVSKAAIELEDDAKWTPFHMFAFRDAILSQLVELQSSDLFNDPHGAKVAEIEGRMLEVQKRLKSAMAAFDADPESPTWSEKVSACDRQLRALALQQREAMQEAANPLPALWTQAVDYMQQNDPQRLRASLLQTVESIWCVFAKVGVNRNAAVQVFFKGGATRFYVIHWQRAITLPGQEKPEKWSVRSLPFGPNKRPIDLRVKADAKRAEKWIASQKV